MRWPKLLSKVKKPAPEDANTLAPSFDQLHIYNALWSLPDHVSGMENSALCRMSDLQQHGSPRSMTLLTFNPRVEVITAKARLVDEGRMNKTTGIRNRRLASATSGTTFDNSATNS